MSGEVTTDSASGSLAQGDCLASPSLRSAAAELYDDLRLSRILSRLLEQSGRLLGAVAGSISLVDAAGGRYAKAAERGAACRLGQSFPLDEGVTGRVAAGRRPVVLSRYSDIATGHLPPEHPAAHGSVAAVPIWWRGEVLGVNVAFAGRDRRFTRQEVDGLELLSQVGAAGIVTSAAADPSLAALLPQDAPPWHTAQRPVVVTEVGPVRHRDPVTSRVATRLVALVGAAVTRRQADARLRVVLVHQEDRLRVVLHDERGALARATTGHDDVPAAWVQLVAAHAGTLSLERVPGWGVLVLADLPHEQGPGVPSGLSPRESEVLELLGRGLTDREIAAALVLSPKTVEKHVGAVLRKTGTSSRTAAVVRALESGWLRPAPSAS